MLPGRQVLTDKICFSYFCGSMFIGSPNFLQIKCVYSISLGGCLSIISAMFF